MKYIKEVDDGILFAIEKDNKGRNRIVISIRIDSGVVQDVYPCVDDIGLNELYRLVTKAREFFKEEQKLDVKDLL